ncbi:TetR/AcrR family transcriptional regulator [Antrihabitans sp. YC2-6]|uniref:TetR/AcrR family transcriptional regulator n=1 Tax=Antrihabitans sp. YC2-6 TaxID=2799498 RepID=UPI0018F566D3|nr:TetR/AcrR family transcriptional regulator [Antrihabitans sp. YC2-6]MBJ8346794.1 TetR/AcrR family transcriptional regulator [Antrihabitans sp. YC2-6]
MSTSNDETISDQTASTDAMDAIDQAVLDAARSCIEDFGVKRTTLAEIARRAGVSRPTVYRRWPDTNTLIGELLNREIRSMLATNPVGHAHGRERMVREIVEGAAAMRGNSLFQKIFRTDTDIVLTYVVDRLGRSQRALIALFAEAIRTGQADGSIRDGDPAQLATMVLLIAQSTVQSARIVEDTLAGAAVDTELAKAIDGYLRPIGDTR